MKVDGIFVEILKERRGNGSEFSLSVTICGGRISVDRSKITLPENKWIAKAPGLRQPNQCVIYREVPVGMVLAHNLADDARAFASRLVRLQPHLLHRV